jgi:2-haloalkanoic acid dehalogenase type II
MRSPRILELYELIALLAPPNPDKRWLVFDVFGTLVDWDNSIWAALRDILPQFWSREDSLNVYSFVEKTLQDRFPGMPYRDLLARAHEVIYNRLEAVQWNMTPEEFMKQAVGEVDTNSPMLERHINFANTLPSWVPFLDTVEALERLAEHFNLAVLSNVDRESFSSTHTRLTREGSKSPFTLVLTAEDVGAYKPSPKCLEYFLSLVDEYSKLGCVDKDNVVVVANSLYHDHIPAKKFGLRSVWIDRVGNVMGVEKKYEEVAQWDWKFLTLGGMADAVEQEGLLRVASDVGVMA